MLSKSVFAAAITMLLFAMATLGCGQSKSHTYMYRSSSKQGWLGVEVQDVDQRTKEKKHLDVDAGACVTKVVEDSPAEDAGIQQGDVILRFDGKAIDDSDDLIKAVRRTKPKTEVKIDIARGKDRKTISATLSRASAPQAFSFNFNDRDFSPRIPMQPFRMHMFSTQSFYGMEVQTLTKQLGEYFEAPNGKGVLVSDVRKGSRADTAGIKAGDVITKVGKEVVHDIDGLREELSDRNDKDVQLEVLRKGKVLTLTLKAGDDDENDDDYSDDVVIPQSGSHWRMHDQEYLPGHRGELGHLKEHLKELGERLKENMHRLKERIREDLHSL